MPHKTFEELPVWRLGRDLVQRVYALTRRPEVTRDHGFCDQLQRAAVSVTNNIAEGHERGTTVELAVFLFYAKGSAGEVRSMLWNAEDIGYLNLLEAGDLRQLAGHICAQLHQWIASMQTPDFNPGPRYHQAPPAGLRRWELYLEQHGLFRLPDGRYVERTPGGGEKGSDDGGT